MMQLFKDTRKNALSEFDYLLGMLVYQHLKKFSISFSPIAGVMVKMIFVGK